MDESGPVLQNLITSVYWVQLLSYGGILDQYVADGGLLYNIYFCIVYCWYLKYLMYKNDKYGLGILVCTDLVEVEGKIKIIVIGKCISA